MNDFRTWKEYKCSWAAVRLAAAIIANNGIVSRKDFVNMLRESNIKNAKESAFRAIQDLESEDLIIRSRHQVKSKDLIGLADFVSALIDESSQTKLELQWSKQA